MRHLTTNTRAARSSRRLFAAAAAGLAVLISATASAAQTATFSASFQAERSAQWDQPRAVNLIDCHGQHYLAASGDDDTTIKTRRAFTVTVTRNGRAVYWQFGSPPNPTDPLSYGIETHGVSTRSYTVHSGTTGGWCGGAQTDPPPATDCGTRLPAYQTLFSGAGRELTWSASFAPRAHERFDFYTCPLTVPDGMHASSFSTLPGRIDPAALFNRRRRTLVITASKGYGPTATPLSNLGVDRTARGSVSWKLTLSRVR